jgi:hypothetical protein
MAFMWYINPESQTEDGFTPATGYHSYLNLSISRTLSDGDVVNFVNNGIIDDSSSALFVISNSITLQSWPSNTSKPTWKTAQEVSIIGTSSFSMSSLVLVGTTNFLINGYLNSPADPTCKYVSINKCDFSLNASVIIYGITSGSIVNNIFRNNTSTPLHIDNVSGSTIPNIDGVAINNNTFYGIMPVRTYCISVETDFDVNNFKILNNIYSTANGSLYFYIQPNASATNILIDYDLDYNAGDIYISYPGFTSILSPNSIHNTDPLLTDPANGDFTLQSDSPCINRGIDNSTDPSVPTDDFIGTHRPNSVHTDIGAYEYIFPIPPVPPPPYPSVASFYPGYRLQNEDLNMSFYAQGLVYPAGLTYSYTPYSVSYEIDYIDAYGDFVLIGSTSRIPQLVVKGTYRPNLIIEDSWTPGQYQITWKYQISGDSDFQYYSEIFDVVDLGVHYVPFEINVCNLNLPAIFNVIQETSYDLPGSFMITP